MSNKKILKQVEQAADYLRGRYKHELHTGIVLGSGLGNFTKEMQIEKEVPYAEIPHFPLSTVKGHDSKLIFGRLNGKRVVAMAGRFHFYEGYDAGEVVFPIRVMKWLGIRNLMLSNASGTVNPHHQVGDLVIITDHISLFVANPLIGRNIDEFGPRFPDMSNAYDGGLVKKAKEIAARLGHEVREGIYLAVTGPTFETRAEYRMIRVLGADIVGMSTVQEAIAAAHMGLRVFAMSVVTDIGLRDDGLITTHEEVLAAANKAEPKLAAIFKELVAAI
jgi:purine-nucleoside phosphorylase